MYFRQGNIPMTVLSIIQGIFIEVVYVQNGILITKTYNYIVFITEDEYQMFKKKPLTLDVKI